MKLLNIIKEAIGEEENDTSFLDKKFYRQALNYIINSFPHHPINVNPTTLLVDVDSFYSEISYIFRPLLKYINNEFSGINKDEINNIMLLYLFNRNVKNFLTDSLNTGEGYNFYSMSYNGPIEITQEEYEDDCDNCNGYGNIESECDICNGNGRIEVDGTNGDDWQECSVCQGDGLKEIECIDCDGYGSDSYMGYVHEIKSYDSVIIVKGVLNEIDYDDETLIDVWVDNNNNEGFIWNSTFIAEDREEMKQYLTEIPDIITQIEHIPIYNKINLSNMLRY